MTEESQNLAAPDKSQKGKIWWLILIIVAIAAFVLFFRTSSLGSSWLWNVSQEGKWMLPLVVVSSLIDSINPCAFSVLLLTIAFLLSIGKLRSGILKIGGVYVLGLFVIYLLIGLGIIQTLHLFNTPHFMAKVGASLLIALGAINIINEFYPNFPIKLKIPVAAHHRMASYMEKTSVPAAFMLGAFVGICEFPCTGGPYLMVLGLLHDQATYLRGFGYLVLYNLIFVLPLVLILILASREKVLEKFQAWQRTENRNMRLWAGVAMIALAILILNF